MIVSQTSARPSGHALQLFPDACVKIRYFRKRPSKLFVILMYCDHSPIFREVDESGPNDVLKMKLII